MNWWTKVGHSVRRRAQTFECLLIFFTCVFVYLANDQLISSNDSIPNTLLAFNWLENHALTFDIFRQGHHYMPNHLYGSSGIPYFFVEAPNGHLSSSYPIGSAIVSFPIAVVHFIYLKLTALLQANSWDFSVPLDVTSQDFEVDRQHFEKLAASVLTALSTTIFYLATRLKFSRIVSLITTFIYAFSTLNWVIGSQGLWQHTASNVVLVSAILALFKANRSEGYKKIILLVAAGFFCGLLPGIRPTGFLFSAAIVIYSILAYRQRVLFLFIGASSILLNITWNVYFFGFSLRSLLVGGYSNLFNADLSSYEFTIKYFKEAFWGLLVSPSRGLLIFSPILLFSIAGIIRIFKRNGDQDETLLRCLAIASLLFFIQYCFYIPWWGAITYGSRFLVDILPVLCYLICYFLKYLFESNWQHQSSIRITIATLFAVSLFFSTFTQVVGAFSDRAVWDRAPQFQQARFWNWQDSQISRHAKNLWFKIDNPLEPINRYTQGLDGEINQIRDIKSRPISNTITVKPSQFLSLKAEVQNTGRSQWYGYKTGLPKGSIMVRVQFFDQQGNAVRVVSPNLLYAADNAHSGETITAMGRIWFPQQPGQYKMVFQLIAGKLSSAFKGSSKATYEMQATVKNGV